MSSYSVSVEGFESLAGPWAKLLDACPERCVFLTPEWQRTWWRHFGSGGPLLLAVRCEGELVGIAPLMKTEEGLSVLGSGDVCDYLDIIALPGRGGDVARAVLKWTADVPWRSFKLFSLRPTSVALTELVPLARALGYGVAVEQEDVSPGLDLPGSWEDYLELLGPKNRHELRRKLRRLSREPGLAYQVLQSSEELEGGMPEFFALFRDNQPEKRVFLQPRMEEFFKDMAQTMARTGWLRLFFMTLGESRVSAVLGFDYGDTFYLYNSGFGRRYAHLAVGLLLKAHCIGQSIAAGKHRFDFLRGDEPYKYDLGGEDAPVYRCVISRA